jgi:DNA-binding transcriptional MerR regulator
MPYTMDDLVRRAGVSARTIREYMRLGFVDPPTGHGLAAAYDDDQMLYAVAVARMRAEGTGWEAIRERVTTWSVAKVRAYVRKTDPKPPAPDPVAPPPSPPEPPALDGEPVGPRARLPHSGAAREDRMQRDGDFPDSPVPDGSHYVFCPVLPGLVLLVSADATPLVRRIAAEMIERYGAGR